MTRAASSSLGFRIEIAWLFSGPGRSRRSVFPPAFARWQRRSLCWAIVVCLWLTAPEASAAEQSSLTGSAAEKASASTDMSSPIRFLRVYAPADRIPQWPLGEMKYVPVEGAEFERLIRLMDASSAVGRPAVELQRAQYMARFSGPAFLEGEALFQISVPKPEAAVLRWPKWRLAVRGGTWLTTEGKPAQPAVLGLSETGDIELLVPASGQLRVNWSFQGEPKTSGLVPFDLQLPPCPHTELRLDLPEGFRPVLDGVLIRKQEPPSGPGRQNWLLEWGGPMPGPVCVCPEEKNTITPSLLIQQEARYTLRPEALEGQILCTVQPLRESVSELSLLVEKGLEVVRLHLAGQEVSWNMLPSEQPELKRLWIRLPSPLSGKAQKLELEVLGPVVLDRAWSIPRIRLEGAVWQQGTLELRIRSPLVLQKLVPVGCRHSKSVAPESNSPTQEEYHEFQDYSPQAAVEVVLGRWQPKLQAETGCVVRLSDRQMSCRVRTRLRVDAGEHFLVEAQVARRWLIDAVEADAATQVEDWSLEPDKANGQRLVIRLTRPVTAQRPVNLMITGRRLQSPVGRTWRTEDLVPIRFVGCQESKRLAAVCPTDASYELICLTPEPSLSLTAGQLDPADWELVEKTGEGFLFWVTPQTEALQWVLRARPPRFRVKMSLDVLASQKSLAERYRILCTPESARVERVVVVFSHARPEPVRWTVSGDVQRQCIARRLQEKDFPAQKVPGGGEAWEILLRPSRSEAFEILGQRTSALGPETPVALIGVPQAASQEASLRIRTVGPDSPQIASCRLQTIPALADDFVPGWTDQLASFRYDPTQELAGPRPPAVLLSASSSLLVSEELWAWQGRLESRFQPDGQADHTAAYWLAHFRRTRLTLSLPLEVDSSQLEGVWLNGQQIPCSFLDKSPEGFGPSIGVTLPADRTFSILVLRFRSQEEPLRHSHKLRPLFPQLDVPVLNRVWICWLPPGLEALCPPGSREGEGCSEISVRERLFGIWARPVHRQPFDPFRRTDWQTLYAGDPLAQQTQIQMETFFSMIGSFLATPSGPAASAAPSAQTSASARRWTWGELLQQLGQQEVFRRGTQILIDRQGVWEAGIDPSSPVRISATLAKGAEQRAGREALWQAGLALAVGPGTILITSSERAAQWRASGQDLDDPLICSLPSETLVRQTAPMTRGRIDPAFVEPEVWQEAADPSLPALVRPLDWNTGSSMLGWSAYRIPILDSADVQVELLDRSQMQAWYWIAFLPALGIGLLLIRHSLAGAVLVVGLVGMGALLGPEKGASVGAGAFSGMLLALMSGLFVGRIRSPGQPTVPQTEPAPPPPAVGSSKAMIHGLVLVALWGPVQSVLDQAHAWGAEQSPPPSAPTAAPLYRVFIPVNEKEQPTGDPYQVPEPFYQFLRRRAQSALPAASRWRIRQAIYRGELSWNATANRWEIPRLTVLWQWDLVGKLPQVSLPIPREQFPLNPGAWSVDGEPMEPQWNDQGTWLSFPVPTSASTTLRIEGSIRPVAVDQGTVQGVDLRIPPVPESRLELVIPADAPEIRLRGALGTTQRLADPTPRLVVELGPTEQVSLRWASGVRASEPSVVPEVQQLLWLHLQPGAVLLDVQFRVQNPQGSPGAARLRVMTENRLRLIRTDQEGTERVITISPAPAGPLFPSPGGQIFEFSLPSTSENQPKVVTAQFLVAESTGLGNVRLPKIEPLEARIQKRWLAVSVDSSLEYPEPSPQRPEAIPVEEFLNLWGSAEQPPQWVDNLPISGPGWSLVTRPRTPNTSVEQILSLGYGEKTIRLWYEARLSTTSGSSFQHRLQAPSDLEIESITVLQENKALPVRWARSPDGKWSLFFPTALSGRYELRVLGVLPNTLSQPRPIPYLEIEGAEIEWATLELYRQPEVLLRIANPSGLTEMEVPPPQEPKSSLGRPFKSFVVDSRQITEAEIQVAPNRPQGKLRQITVVRPEIDSWAIELDLQLEVQRGLVDEILLEAPPCWPGPYKTSPQVNLSTKELSEGRRALVIRPVTPIEQTYRLRIAGPLRWQKNDPLELPKVLSPSFLPPEHLLLLPTQFQLHPIIWETQGLEKIPVPQETTHEVLGQEAWEAYRPLSGEFAVRLQTPVEPQQPPEVRLADIHLHWNAEGTCSGKAWFYLFPAGQDRCVVSLPPGFRLLHLQVEANPATPILDQQSDRYTVLLGSAVLPQVLQVDFQGRLPPEVLEGLRPFAAPRIDNWQLTTSLWTIYPPPGYELAEPEGVGRVPPLQLDAYRLRTIGGLLETGCRQSFAPQDDFFRWYRGWKGRFSSILAQVHRQLALPPTTELHRTVRVEAQSLQLKLRQLAEKLSLPDPQTDSSPPTSSAEAVPIGLTWRQSPVQLGRAVVHGPSHEMILSYRKQKISDIPLRGILALGLALGAIGLAWTLYRNTLATSLAPWASLATVVAGGIWWLWLWPSPLGWVIILGGLAASFWKGFRFPKTRRKL